VHILVKGVKVQTIVDSQLSVSTNDSKSEVYPLFIILSIFTLTVTYELLYGLFAK